MLLRPNAYYGDHWPATSINPIVLGTIPIARNDVAVPVRIRSDTGTLMTALDWRAVSTGCACAAEPSVPWLKRASAVPNAPNAILMT